MRLKLDYVLTCNISDDIEAITFKLSMTADVWMSYMSMLISMTLTWMQFTVRQFDPPPPIFFFK